MSLGIASRKEKRKRRNQSILSIVKMIFFFAAIGSTFYYAVDLGGEVHKSEIADLKDKYKIEQQNNSELRKLLGTSKANLEKFSKLLPSQDIRDLLNVVNNKKGDGVKVSRMAGLISGMTLTENCSSVPVLKRTAIATPIAPITRKISFSRGLITVEGKGSPALNKGKPESWFDVTKKVDITFTLPGGQKQEISGMLPLYPSITIKKTQYKFSIIAGKRSFINVSMVQCKI